MGASTQEHHHFSFYCWPLNSALEETFRPTNLQDLPTISCLTLLCASSLCFWIPLLLCILFLCCWLFLFDKLGFHVIHCHLDQYTLLFPIYIIVLFLFNQNQVNSKETIKTTTGLEYNLFFHEIFNAAFKGFFFCVWSPFHLCSRYEMLKNVWQVFLWLSISAQISSNISWALWKGGGEWDCFGHPQVVKHPWKFCRTLLQKLPLPHPLRPTPSRAN